MNTSLHGQSLIAGTVTEPAGRAFHPVSPLDSKPLEPGFHACTLADVDRALHHADDAFAIFRRSTGEQRAGLLEKIAEEIMALGDALLERTRQETGLPLDRLTGERARTCNQLRLFAEVAR